MPTMFLKIKIVQMPSKFRKVIFSSIQKKHFEKKILEKKPKDLFAYYLLILNLQKKKIIMVHN